MSGSGSESSNGDDHQDHKSNTCKHNQINDAQIIKINQIIKDTSIFKATITLVILIVDMTVLNYAIILWRCYSQMKPIKIPVMQNKLIVVIDINSLTGR